jgi:hypothetical protein
MNFKTVYGFAACFLLGLSGTGLHAVERDAMVKIGRGQVKWLDDQRVWIKDAYLLVNDSNLKDFTFSFEGRAPAGAKADEIGIWATFRQFDRNHRYVVGLRGAPHSDVYLARYAPDGNDRMLALENVPAPIPGQWYSIKVEARGSEIKIYLNNVEVVVAEDKNTLFSAGKVGLGGGYLASEYRNFSVHAGVTDSKPKEVLSFSDDAIKINFQPGGESGPDGWKVDSGATYTASRGYGWTKEVGTRKRRQFNDFLSDTMVVLAHEQTEGEFKLDLEPGEYVFTLQHGDSYPSAVNVLYRQDALPLRSVAAAGQFKQVSGQVSVGKEGLTLKFTRPLAGPGTSLNWLVVEKRDHSSRAESAKGIEVEGVSAEKAALKKAQRAKYVPVTVAPIQAGRTEVSLDGDWLLLPDYEFSKTKAPETVDADDSDWHVMKVPDLWSPYAAWLFGEVINGMPRDKGASDTYYDYRHARVNALTFDWEKTKSAWYRKEVVLPEIPKGKRFELCFDAIAKVSTIYVNGVKVGANLGMFGDIRLDVTDQLHAGSNLIAVKVDDELSTIENGDEIVDVAISVEVTRKMLAALPHGMTVEDPRGIWQPTKLVITDAACITDVFVKPRLDGADVDVTLSNRTDKPVNLLPKMSVVSKTDDRLLVQVEGKETTVPVGGDRVVTLAFSNVSPRLWSPDDPQLYSFNVALNAGKKTVDTYAVVSGFKTFEAKGNRLFLNGRPYLLRGADHNPNLMAPNDGVLADRYMQILKENNINSTRFHAVPATAPWMDAADRKGVLVSYEGTWPWLMLRGPIPPKASLDIWMNEFERLIRKYRNHPSLMLWTVNNEMKFHVFHAHSSEKTPEYDADTLARWKVVSKAVKMIRQTDPTHPVVADSCYVRGSSWKLNKTPGELGIDDGDIDDIHAYNNWYNESVFNLFDQPFGDPSPDRPFIGQELSTGYYNGDSGHPVRAYLFVHQTPQSWVGQWAYEHQDPSIFLQRQCMLTKELAEYFRREHRDDMAGEMIFGLVTWFKNQWDAGKIEPYPVVTDGLRNALAPVLVSARLTGRNYFAGDTFSVPVSIINDREDGKSLAAGTLKWRFVIHGAVLSQGDVPAPAVAYYSNKKVDVALKIPAAVPGGRADADLCFDLDVGGKIVSSNHYGVKIGQTSWAIEPAGTAKGKVIACKPSEVSKNLFKMLGIKTTEIKSLKGLRLASNDQLVIDGKVGNSDREDLKAIIRDGRGVVLWMRPQAQAAEVFPEQVLEYRKQNGEIVTMLVPESPVFNGIEIGDMAWMGGPSVKRVPLSSLGGYHVAWKNPNLTVLAEEMKAHGYLNAPGEKLKSWVTPLVSIQQGDLRIILSEMSVDDALTDPMALRLWANLLSQL